MEPVAALENREEANRRRELAYLERPDNFLTDRQRRWLESPGGLGRVTRSLLYGINYLGVRLLFNLQTWGQEHLPALGPYIIAPSHASSLDPFVLSAALGRRRMAQAVWAGRRGALLDNRLRRFVNRLAHAIPIRRNAKALAVGAAALERGRILIWFPEGHRSGTGQLQPFRRGVGMLMDHFQVPAAPAYISGAYEAMPRHARLPHRLTQITVAFGPPLDPTAFAHHENREQRIAALVETLRERVVQLSRQTIHTRDTGAS